MVGMDCLDHVGTGHQHPPVFTSVSSGNVLVPTNHLYNRSTEWFSIFIKYFSLHSHMDRLQKHQHGVQIVLPLNLEMTGRRSFPARKLCSDLHAVWEEVIEVLHAIVNHIPLCTVTDSLVESFTMAQTLPGNKIAVNFTTKSAVKICWWFVMKLSQQLAKNIEPDKWETT